MSLPACKFYSINQTCRFGKQCRFSHTLNQRPPPSQFQQASDKDGENVIKQAYTVSDQAENKITGTARARSNYQSSEYQQHDNKQPKAEAHPVRIHLDLDLEQGTKKSCSFYASGWCKYGRNCKFSHNFSRGKVPPRFQKPQSNDPNHVSESTNDTLQKFQHENIDRIQSAPVSSGNYRARVRPAQSSAINNEKILSQDGAKQQSGDSQSQAESGTQAESKNSKTSQSNRQNKKSQVRKLCTFYKAGYCKKGDRCHFSHGSAPQTSDKNNVSLLNEGKPSKTCGNKLPSQRPTVFKQVFTLDELEAAGQTKVRDGEVEAIKKRFPKDKISYTVIDESFVATIKFVPSDPDWPFDVKEYMIQVTVPQEYPKKVFDVALPLDQDLPATVRSYVEVRIQDWLLQKQEQLTATGKAELVFRPFLRWLDRNIEEITTEALKQLRKELTARAAGFEFIPAEQLQAKLFSAGDKTQNDEEAKQVDYEDDDDTESDGLEDSEESDDDSSDENDEGNTSLDLQPQQRGTEVYLRHLQLKEAASAILFQKLTVVLTCGRCKTRESVGVSQGTVSSLNCGKCQNSMHVTFRPGLAHAFTSIVGYLDTDGCSAFDLVLQDCRASVSCGKCSKQTVIDGMVTGQLIDGWCKACNARFKLATEAVKLTQLAPSGIDSGSVPVVNIKPSGPRKPPKDPAIRDGQPLPGFGTCKHYKQSFRWLRFPCCGKAFPCDVCHDRSEDHPYELATRMICGHCCREQNFTTGKPCTSCGEHTTKTRTAHWEGGSGCRDKISMSKGDSQKYKNINKTISNKKKADTKPKKKNTKLRHS